jgi:pimeloyl-ACP methyl ester carboxylesterase
MEKMVAPVAPGLRAEVVENCGHFVPEEAPQAGVRLLREFI